MRPKRAQSLPANAPKQRERRKRFGHASSTNGTPIPTANGKGKIQLLTREHLDGRTRAHKQFDAIANAIARDIGEDQLSTIQRHLVEAFAGVALHVHDLNARLLLGLNVDAFEHSQAISTLVRVASRLPIARVPKQIQSVESDLKQRRTSFEEAAE